jgi:hypothetical protein
MGTCEPFTSVHTYIERSVPSSTKLRITYSLEPGFCKRNQNFGQVDQISEVLEIVLEKPRECLAPLHKGLWKSPRQAMLNRIGTKFDPVPGIKSELELEFERERVLRPQRLRVCLDD